MKKLIVRKSRPITNGTRHLSYVIRDVDRVKPDKSLIDKKNSANGVNFYGRKCVKKFKFKKKYRKVDFKFSKFGENYKISTIEYDPNRSANIAKVVYEDGTKNYILAPKNAKRGEDVIAGDRDELMFGNSMKIKDFPIGSEIYNLELSPNGHAKIARSAGSCCTLISYKDGYCKVKLPSGEIRLFHEECRANYGIVGNENHELRRIGKAGRSVRLGRYQKVRGVAMSWGHKHAGGEGRGSIAGNASNYSGNMVRGKKTRRNTRSDKLVVVARKKGRGNNG